MWNAKDHVNKQPDILIDIDLLTSCLFFKLTFGKYINETPKSIIGYIILTY